MDLQDNFDIELISNSNQSNKFLFSKNEENWNNIIKVKENTPAKLKLIGDSENKLYLDGIDILFSEATNKNELHQKKANKYFNDEFGAFVNFNQEEIILFDPQKDNYMDHTLIPGIYRLMVITPKKEKYYTWLNVTPKQINGKDLEHLIKDLENTIEGLAKISKKNDNGFMISSYGLSKKDLKILEILCCEKKNFQRSTYRIINNPIYQIKCHRFWTDKLATPLDPISINKSLIRPNNEKKFFSKKRYINYSLKENFILKKQYKFLLNEILHLMKKINNYKNKTGNVNSFNNELEVVKAYQASIIEFFKSDWVSELDCTYELSINNILQNYDYLYINKLFRKIKFQNQDDSPVTFSRQYSYYYHRTDVLYEVWAFVKVIEAFNKLEFEPIEGWIFNENKNEKKCFGELKSGEIVTLVYRGKNKNSICKYVKLVYDKVIESDDENSCVEMEMGYTRNRPDIRVEFYDENDKILFLIIMDTKYRLYEKIFDVNNKKQDSLKQFNEYENGIKIKPKFKSKYRENAESQIKSIIDQNEIIKNYIFIFYPKYNMHSKPEIESGVQYRINLVPNSKNLDLVNSIDKCLESTTNKWRI